MPIRLTPKEKTLRAELVRIKEKSSSHSPSPVMLAKIKGMKVTHDFCFLSSPHATDLFLKYWKRDFRNASKLRSIVEYYPSQNRALAEKVAIFLKHPLSISPSKEGERIGAKNIFVGNGATEVIQAVLQNFTKKKILVPVPTFSPYLEFAPKGVKTVLHQLRKEDFFRLNLKKMLADVRKEKPDTVIVINPNNPEGGHLSLKKLRKLVGSLKNVPTVVVDESFSHFTGRTIESTSPLVKKHPNLVVIKSLSKDFGIAGVRLGYGVMSPKRVSALLERGYLWNVSGFGEYFLDLLNRKDFLREYERARQKAIRERDEFFDALSRVRGLKVYPSKANAFLIELTDGSKAKDLTVALLSRYGIYVRDCADKVGLNGEFIRVASRSAKENALLVRTLWELLSYSAV